jgi:hypothetical protein
MKTAAEIKAWLESPTSTPILLVETFADIAGTETALKFSVGDYSSEYLPIVSIGVEYVQQLSINLSPTNLSYSDLKIHNPNHEFDYLLNYVWSNRVIVQKVGDVEWAIDDFFTVFTGYITDIDSQDAETLNLKIIDRFQQLNAALNDVVLGGTSTNKNVIVPSAFGENFNAIPILVSQATQTYQGHSGGQIEDFNEVLTDAKVRLVTKDLTTGKFSFTTNVGKGMVTTTMQGDKFGGVYSKTVATVIQRIVTGYGKVTDRLTAADIDTANFAAFNTANPQTIGYYSTGRENIYPICQFLASSVGAQMVPTMDGKLRLVKIELPAPGVQRVIDQSYMFQKNEELRLVERPPVQPTVVLGFCKNNAVQDNLDGIPLEHEEMLALEWLKVKSDNSTLRTKYKKTLEPVMRTTALQIESEAQAECDRLRILWSTQRGVYEFVGTSELLDLQLGDGVTLVHPYYNMSAGASGMVVKLKPNWLKREVLVGVLA